MTDGKTSGAIIAGKIGSRKIVFAGSVALVCLVGLGGWESGLLKRHKARSIQPVVTSPSEPTYVETPEIVANLDAGPHRIAFAKLQCRIALDRATDVGVVTVAMPRIVDAAQTYLRVLRPEELRSGAGAYLLREALIGRVAAIAPSASVQDVLFEEFIVQ